MRSSSLIIIVSILFIILTDVVLAYQIRQYLRKRWQLLLYIFQSLCFVSCLLVFQYSIARLKGPEGYFWIGKMIGIIFLFYTPKFLFILLNGIGRLFRRFKPGFSGFMTMLSTTIAVAIFILLLYSITLGRYNYKLETVRVPIPDLPVAFNDFKIIQLTDIHLGSYGESYKGIAKLVDRVNALHPDLIVFTGDMVNNFANEMDPWIGVLQKLQASYGKYAVTGNHDYGDYTHWSSPEAKRSNMERFYQNMEKMGFHLLNNTSVPILLHGDTLWLAGVENWGKPPFPRYGNLKMAIDSIGQDQTIVLLSHDPSHWKAEVQKYNIPLTLSGHTHAMQSGIKIGKKEWSPAQYIYPEYDGLYRQGHQYLHVSRGQGYLGFPGRIGLRPVITEIILTSVSQQ